METTLSAEQIIKNTLPCTCDEAYKSRNLSAPDCPYCNYGEDMVVRLKEYARIQIQSSLTEKQLRKMAKKACDGNQHAMRYNIMLECCFKMGQMVLQELRDKQSITSTLINLK